MLRISQKAAGASSITLKVEGRLMSEWVAVLEKECRAWAEKGYGVLLDFCEVSFIDSRGVEAVKALEAEGVRIINCPSLIEDLLKGGK